MSDTWVKWEVPRWWGSDARAELPAAARAIYLELLFHCLMSGSLPPDPSALSAKAAVSLPEFKKHWPLMEHRFPLVDGRRIHGVASQNAKERIERDPKKVAAGRSGGLAKAARSLLEIPSTIPSTTSSTVLHREEKRREEEKETPTPSGLDLLAHQLIARHPKKGDPVAVERAIHALAADPRFEPKLVNDRHAEYCRRIEDPKYAPRLSKWLDDGGWLDDSLDAKEPAEERTVWKPVELD